MPGDLDGDGDATIGLVDDRGGQGGQPAGVRPRYVRQERRAVADIFPGIDGIIDSSSGYSSPVPVNALLTENTVGTTGERRQLTLSIPKMM